MRGPIVLASLAAALFIGHATTKIVPPAEQPAPAVAALERAVAPETLGSAPSESAPVPPPVSPPVSWGLQPRPISTKAAFAYAKNHPATPLSEASFAALANLDGQRELAFAPVVEDDDLTAGQLQTLSRNGLCSAIVAVARANDLPIPFFANLIWQESSFRSKTISSAGALGIAQFIPETAIEHGLMNPFEPVHALFASGRLLRKLNQKFGNLGLAAAAYNAGPGRVYDWMADRKTLPGETRAYVVRITGHRASQWTSSDFARSPEATLMPARAPCAEVAEEVQAQAKVVRVSRLMSELAAATAPGVLAEVPLPRKNMRRLHRPELVARVHAPAAVRTPVAVAAPVPADKAKQRTVLSSAKDASRPPGVVAQPAQKRMAVNSSAR
jgi:soluble lytic murein transglycosylase-like protein